MTQPAAGQDYILEMRHIVKTFDGLAANDDITFTLKAGEIHALLGENGAGKSTLMHVLFGLQRPDRGTIVLRGKPVLIDSPRSDASLGIGMVHQHFKLVHPFTVTENIMLGREPRILGLIRTGAASQRIRELSNRYGLDVAPDDLVENISVGMQQRVEILKMLYGDADILIFDEPTAVLTPQETSDLLRIMKQLAAEGKAVILITHKLREIKAIAHRCTVIRRGQLVGTVDVASATEQSLADMMVGRPVSFQVAKKPAMPGTALLRIDSLTVRNNRGLVALHDFSLEVRAGEIVGLAGVDGNGQTELVEAVAGLRPVAAGRIELDGLGITAMTVRERIEAGLAHVPADRQRDGLVPDYTVADNMVLNRYYRSPFAHNGLLRQQAIKDYAGQITARFDVRAAQGVDSPARSLSGGNQQKTIIGRELSLDPKVLVAVQPTRGLDAGSVEYIHRQLVEMRHTSRAVLLVSLELEEILKLADRIAVLCQGRLVGVVNAADTTEREVGLWMTGVKQKDAHEAAVT